MVDFTKKHASCKLNLFKEFERLLERKIWTKDMISEAESNCDLESGYCHILFPSGMGQILQEFEEWQDSSMLFMLPKKETSKKIREQIAEALEIRIMQVISKDAAINHNSAFLLPENVLVGNQAAMHTCDLIWKYAGDRSTDFNYYTKRGLLLPVYFATKAFYFADNSPDHQDTKLFIKNALDNIVNVASLKNRIQLPRLEDIPILRLFL